MRVPVVMEKLDATPLADEAKNLLLAAVREFATTEEKKHLKFKDSSNEGQVSG